MNLLILATLVSVALAEKSPRLKFTVMGKMYFFFGAIVSVCLWIRWRVLEFSRSQSLMFIRTKAEMSNLFFPRENKNCCVVRLPIPLGCKKQKTSDHIVSKWKQAKMGH